MPRIASALLGLVVLTAGCGRSEPERLAIDESEALRASRVQVERLSQQNGQLIAAQSQTIKELEQIRNRQKQLEDQINTSRSIQQVSGSTLTMSCCALAVCCAALWHRRRRND